MLHRTASCIRGDILTGRLDRRSACRVAGTRAMPPLRRHAVEHSCSFPGRPSVRRRRRCSEALCRDPAGARSPSSRWQIGLRRPVTYRATDTQPTTSQAVNQLSEHCARHGIVGTARIAHNKCRWLAVRCTNHCRATGTKQSQPGRWPSSHRSRRRRCRSTMHD